ncbi:hypothetical protein GQ457_02G024590 [Hibiscus cannabinus]
MAEIVRSTNEKNSDVQLWSEGEQQVDGDSTSAHFVSEMMAQVFTNTGHNDISGLKTIWDNWGHEMRSAFKRDYGDIAHLLYVPIDETLLQALVKYWNPYYRCFTFGNVDLTPTIKEYSALIKCSKNDKDRVYSKSNKNKPFRGKLEKLLGALPCWVENQVAKNNQNEYIKWEGILTLASVSPGGACIKRYVRLLDLWASNLPESIRAHQCISNRPVSATEWRN